MQHCKYIDYKYKNNDITAIKWILRLHPQNKFSNKKG